MSGFIGSAAETILDRYLPYANEGLLYKAYQDKLFHEKNASKRQKLREEHNELVAHLNEFKHGHRGTAPLPQHLVRAIHKAGSIGKAYLERRHPQYLRALTGTPRMMYEDTVVDYKLLEKDTLKRNTEE